MEEVGVAVATVSEWAFLDTCVVGGAVCTVDFCTAEEATKVALTFATVKVCTGYTIEVCASEVTGADHTDESEAPIFVDDEPYPSKLDPIAFPARGR